MNPFLLSLFLGCQNEPLVLEPNAQGPTYCRDLTEVQASTCESVKEKIEQECTGRSPDLIIQCESDKQFWFKNCSDIESIITDNCVSCHHALAPGEEDPAAAYFIPLDDYNSSSIFSGYIAKAVQGGLDGVQQMPPLFDTSSAECRREDQYPFTYPFPKLDELSIGALVEWSESGRSLGDPTTCKYDPYEAATAQDPVLFQKDPKSHLTQGESLFPSNGYTVPARTSQIEDIFICYILDPQRPETSYISGMEFLIDNSKVVHHILLLEDVSEEAQELAGEQGYFECPTGFGSSQVKFLADWIPGVNAIIPPAGAPFKIRGGSKLIMQMHYHNASTPELDQTGVKLSFSDEEPQNISVVFLKGEGGTGTTVDLSTDGTGSLTGEFLIPPSDPPGDANGDGNPDDDGDGDDDPEWVERIQIKIPEFIGTDQDYPIWSVAMHMHYVATRGMLKKVSSTSNTPETCLLEVNWDFNWQQTYHYDLDKSYPTVRGGDLFEAKCVYENHTGDYIRAGEGSNEEMCMGIIGVVIPNTPSL